MIFNVNNIYGSKYWVESSKNNFKSLVVDSRIPQHWQELDEKYFNDYLFPANNYVVNFGKAPKINNNMLNQETHAEIWLFEKEDGTYALDKCWQRQFYPSNNIYEVPTDCFLGIYRFYMPWIINMDVELNILNNSTCFHIYTNKVLFKKQSYSEYKFDVPFIDFSIKKTNANFKLQNNLNLQHGIIDIGSLMYSIELNDQLAERLNFGFKQSI